MSALFTQCPADTVQTRTGKDDPARKFKCTTAARGHRESIKFNRFIATRILRSLESCRLVIFYTIWSGLLSLSQLMFLSIYQYYIIFEFELNPAI